MIEKIFEEIRKERKRQDEKWGEQNPPMVGMGIFMDGKIKQLPPKRVMEGNIHFADVRYLTLI